MCAPVSDRLDQLPMFCLCFPNTFSLVKARRKKLMSRGWLLSQTTEGSLFRRTPTRTASSKVTTSDENQVRSQFASEVASCSTPGSK